MRSEMGKEQSQSPTSWEWDNWSKIAQARFVLYVIGYYRKKNTFILAELIYFAINNVLIKLAAAPSINIDCLIFIFFNFFFFHILCLCVTFWVMTNLLSILYIHFPAWRKALYFYTISFVAFGLSLLSPSLFYWLISKLVFLLLVISPLPFKFFLPCFILAAYLCISQKLQFWPNCPLVC